MPTTIRREEIEVGEIDHTLNLIPEELFFSDREEGNVRPNTVPLPEGATAWRHARFMGENVHVTTSGDTVFMLADTTIFGYCLFRFVSSTEDDSTLRIAFQRGNRIITKERSQVIMANLNDLARSYQSGVAPMNLGAQTPQTPMAPASGEGIAGNVDTRRLRAEAMSRGYVAGYVMGNAPQLTMSLQNKKDKAGTVISNIVAKESKPSRCLAVLMALPANCVMRNGAMASPSDIQAGSVDYGTTPRDEMIYQAFPVNAAISYIYALGGRLPEYAPHVSDAREQWSAEDIISGKPDVSFVYVHPTENRSRNSSGDRFRFNLKTTSGRRSLYTDRNIVCLRALEHISTKCNTEADAYNLNEVAFGAWRYRKQKDAAENALQKAMAACPSQIWKAQYTVNGETKDGIGSAFFMAGSSVKSESGEEIAQRPLTYMPWYPSGDQRPTVPSRVERLVNREFQPATSDTKERMVTKPVLMKERPTDPLFKSYNRFVDFVVEKGFLSREKLYSLGARASKAKAKSLTLTPEQRTTFEYFMRSEAVDSDIQSVRNEAADRAVLRGQ